MSFRPCSRVACPDESAATLTFDYADSMAVLGPLSLRREPHSFDLCVRHARLTSAPQGWQMIRLSRATDDAAALGCAE
ncbi:DUF3499 family protein [Cryobacterium sp. TMT1-21]|uniref:DUF3499 family protein n=1 Tax=Cryobacterium shii TaxID=1259235 RepID=A0AAQ2HG36_9MICO|nr:MULTISPECIES: DUF3499 family protein [Cryobacterium]TFC48280.1 DUF3499 family protein [Cryobacterium shii]TFC83803.1 DUF3499 family protein [Cryobacterium sp. TmT2-59]TFD15450.1 DUF3499 family protein [Cryobacterium sp. TMT1-21]TFD16657.1 DUF3499 family protein [Cryobacterium sp. TMT4-10]TFD21884.1 DUF3499 family protein [Cryobacterium sp. TMT2-23]